MNVQGYRLPIEVIHPLTHEKIPVYVANYVVADYGEGAVMGVPAHDERDKSFAQLFKLPCKQVVKDQKLMNSQQFDGLTVKEATEKILTEAQQQLDSGALYGNSNVMVSGSPTINGDIYGSGWFQDNVIGVLLFLLFIVNIVVLFLFHMKTYQLHFLV